MKCRLRMLSSAIMLWFLVCSLRAQTSLDVSRIEQIPAVSGYSSCLPRNSTYRVAIAVQEKCRCCAIQLRCASEAR